MLTPSSEDVKHPATDTQIDTREMYYKASSKSSPCEVEMDLLTAQAMDFVAILSHNFESSGVTIKFEGADNSAFTTNLVTKTLTHNATDIFEFFTTMTKRYVRVTLTKGSDFTDYPQFAVVVCGAYSELNRRFMPNRKEGVKDYAESEASDSQVLFTQEREILDTDRYSFEGISNATKDVIKSFFRECGEHGAFVFCADYESANSNSYWVRLNGSPYLSRQVGNFWGWNASLIEVK